MRNQFFTSAVGQRVDLAVSSIVTVIVGAQKNVNRALDKITGKYYADYVNDVVNAASRVLVAHNHAASVNAIADKIREKFTEKYISAASETVLSIIGRGHEKIAVDLELPKLLDLDPPFTIPINSKSLLSVYPSVRPSVCPCILVRK